jgi:pimeloyl-ACP methyl ester carboxylesterase
VRVPETRFAHARGADIAYQVFGQGPVDLLWAPGWISHPEVMWELAEFARFLEHLGRFARVVTFDKRGTGMSDRVEETVTVDERVDDARAVLDAAGVERAILVGWFDAAAIMAVFAARHPGRAQGLVCGSATVKFGADPGEIWGMDPDVIAVAAGAGTSACRPRRAPPRATRCWPRAPFVSW